MRDVFNVEKLTQKLLENFKHCRPTHPKVLSMRQTRSTTRSSAIWPLGRTTENSTWQTDADICDRAEVFIFRQRQAESPDHRL